MVWKYGFLWVFIILISACSLAEQTDPTPTPIAPPQVVLLTPEGEISDLPSPSPTTFYTETPAPPTATTIPIVAPPTILIPTMLPSSTSAPTSIPPTATAFTGQVAADRTGLRLRSAPNTSGTVLANLREFTQLTVYERTSDNIWLRVDTENGQGGWVMTEFVELYVSLEAIPVSGTAQPAANVPPVLQAET